MSELSLLEREVGNLWPCIRNPLIEGFATRENSKHSVKAFVAITAQGHRNIKNLDGKSLSGGNNLRPPTPGPDRNKIADDQEFRREGWTETAIILCKLNKSL